MYPQAATEHYDSQQRLTAFTVAAARRLWARLGTGDFDAAWRVLGPQMAVLLTAAQAAAAKASAAYVPQVLDELSIDDTAAATFQPSSVAGVASSGAPIAVLLYSPLITTRASMAAGQTVQQAQRTGADLLDGIIRTQVADAGRAAESVELVTRSRVTGYVRMLSSPACSRCALLAGRFYKWNSGFLRHPRCNCRHIPSTENVADDMTTDPAKAIKSGQVTGISKADAQAIDDGADIGRVLNARSGMSTAQVLGVGKMKTTTALTKGRSRIRLRPESVYKQANGNRDEALRLLKLHGYIR